MQAITTAPMRTTLTFLVVFFALCAHAQQKVGHLDRAQLMMVLPERNDARTKLESFAKSLEGRLKAMGDEYTSKVAIIQAPPANMTGTELNVAKREVMELEDRITAAQERAQDDLERMEQELMQPMVTKVMQAINDVAAAGGFAYVLDSSAGSQLIYFDKGEDIMPLVKAKLNLK